MSQNQKSHNHLRAFIQSAHQGRATDEDGDDEGSRLQSAAECWVVHSRSMRLDEVDESIGWWVVRRHRNVTLQVPMNHLRQLLTQLHTNSTSAAATLSPFHSFTTYGEDGELLGNGRWRRRETGRKERRERRKENKGGAKRNGIGWKYVCIVIQPLAAKPNKSSSSSSSSRCTTA